MAKKLSLSDHATRGDLRIFLERLLRVGQPEVRIVTRGSALAVYGCTQAPKGITDTVPVVLGMRGFALSEAPDAPVDVTVQARALIDRIARLGIVGLALDLPDVSAIAAWSGVLPPFAGWETTGVIAADSLSQVATEGIERVAATLPESPGEAVVRTVRAQVWGMEVAPGVPAAAAFAAESLGFLHGDEDVAVAHSLTWVRLTTPRGSVLVRSLLG